MDPAVQSRLGTHQREFIDYKTSMITDEDPLRGLLFYQDLGFSHTLHVLKDQCRLDQYRFDQSQFGRYRCEMNRGRWVKSRQVKSILVKSVKSRLVKSIWYGCEMNRGRWRAARDPDQATSNPPTASRQVRNVTKFAPHKALKLIAWRQVDFC